jgi:hypothetical protein
MASQVTSKRIRAVYDRLHKLMVNDLLTMNFDDQVLYTQQLNKLAELMNVLILLSERFSKKEMLNDTAGMTMIQFRFKKGKVK